jgi:hypothetical protein
MGSSLRHRLSAAAASSLAASEEGALAWSVTHDWVKSLVQSVESSAFILHANCMHAVYGTGSYEELY